jgi:anti-sigma factor RsiW
MDCRVARNRMHRLLDGTLADRAPLDAHLADCATCRAHLTRLQHLDGALRAATGAPADEAALDRAASAALRRIEHGRALAAPRAFAWAAVAGLILAFALGAVAGRTAWPRERVVTRFLERRVPVEVVREREVIREVPVVHTRVVYRDRVVGVLHPNTGRPAEPSASAAEPRAPVKLDEIVVRLDAAPGEAPSTVVSRELSVAPTADEVPVAPDPAQPQRQPSGDATDAHPKAGLRFAALTSGVH